MPTIVDPTSPRALGRLRRALSQLDPAFRRDLRTVAADPCRVGAAGLTAGIPAVHPVWAGQFVCPTSAVLLLRGETSWPALIACVVLYCFDQLHQTPTWNQETAAGAAVEDFHDTLDEFAEAAGWARPGHGPQPGRLLDDLGQRDPASRAGGR